MIISLIAALTKNRVIGKNNDLPWRLPDDMKYFMQTTKGHTVIMGRKNYDSIPERFRPLPNRENAVLTRNTDFTAEGCTVFNSLTACLDYYKNDDRTVFIIGGGQIYKEALELGVIDEMYVTHVAKTYDAETFFPEIDTSKWKSETVFSQEKDEKHEAGFMTKRYY